MPEHRAERTCVSCRRKAEKRAFFRIVRTPQGEIAFDGTGNASGRGAYVCSKDCFRDALESGKLSRALRVRLTNEAFRIERELSREDAAEVV